MDFSATTVQKPRTISTIALVALSLGSFMVLLDSTILNVALPNIKSELHSSLTSLQWIVNSYTLIFASLLLTGGILGDRYGVRRIFCFGLLLFTGASFICSVSPTMEVLIFARTVQGVGAALLLPTSLALVAHLFTTAQERARAFSVWAGIASLAVASGPLLGGYLVTTFGWRSVFLINIPCGLATLALTLLSIPRIHAQKTQALDLPGQLLAILACSSLTYGLIEWGHVSVSFVMGALLLAIVAGTAFLLVEARSPRPMLPLSLFRSWTVKGTMLIALTYQFGFYGQIFVFSLFFQQAYGLNALHAGLAFLPQTALGSFMLLFITPRILKHIQARTALIIGLLLGSVGMLIELVGVRTSFALVLVGEVFVGLLAAFIVPPMTTIILGNVAKEQSGIASASLNTARQLGGALGVSILGTVLGSGPLQESIQVTLGIMLFICVAGLVTSISLQGKSENT